MYKPHRATGRPRGRPRVLPVDLDAQVLEALRRRVDPTTGLVKPDWKGLAREFHTSRTTIARLMDSLHRRGEIESVVIHTVPKFTETRYRLKSYEGACGGCPHGLSD